MAFPDTIETFPVMKDISISDGSLVQAYQQAMQAQDLVLAQQILYSIPEYQNKIIDAAFLNKLVNLAQSLEIYYLERFSPAYVVSATQPPAQEKGDFWFQIT